MQNCKRVQAKPNFTGPFTKNERLRQAVPLFKGQVHGVESVAVSPRGELLMLDKYGTLHRAVRVRGGELADAYELLAQKEPVYIGPGRPLGSHVLDDGKALLVCCSLKGLLRLDLRTGSMCVLSNRVSDSGSHVDYANDLDVARDGTVYFSASTQGVVALNAAGWYDTMRSALLNLLRGDASGRLLAYEPRSGRTRVLESGLFFANGVALASDESFVAVVETQGLRVLRHWLTGPQADTRDVLIEGLPGFPDGISRAADGNFWIALVGPWSPIPGLSAPHKWMRQLLSHIILVVLPFVHEKWGVVIKVSPLGEVLDVLMDSTGQVVSTVSAVTEHEGKLYLGNLEGNSISVIDLAAATS